MKKIITNLIIAFNALIWIVLSGINYIGIILQLNENIMKIFLWSIILVFMYGIVIYSITKVLSKLLLIYQFRDNKVKFINNRIFGRQILLLTVFVLYLYGICYSSSYFLGLLPMFLFFSNKLTNPGRFYVYHNERLLVIEDFSKEYYITDIKIEDGMLYAKKVNTINLDEKNIKFSLDSEESKFLTEIFSKEQETKEATEEVVA